MSNEFADHCIYSTALVSKSLITKYNNVVKRATPTVGYYAADMKSANRPTHSRNTLSHYSHMNTYSKEDSTTFFQPAKGVSPQM